MSILYVCWFVDQTGHSMKAEYVDCCDHHALTHRLTHTNATQNLKTSSIKATTIHTNAMDKYPATQRLTAIDQSNACSQSDLTVAVPSPK